MRYLLPLLLAVLALCGELFLREALALDRWAPDLFTVLILFLGTARGLSVTPLVALLGALADGFAGSPLGLHMTHALLLYLAAALLASQVRFRGPLGNALLGVAGGFISLALLALLGRVFLGDTLLAARVADLLVPRVAVVAVAVPLAFPALERLDALVLRRVDLDAI